MYSVKNGNVQGQSPFTQASDAQAPINVSGIAQIRGCWSLGPVMDGFQLLFFIQSAVSTLKGSQLSTDRPSTASLYFESTHPTFTYRSPKSR